MTIGEKIRHLRQKHDVTQEKLAEYLNITYQSVSKWESGKALPDISLVVPLANFFGITIDELFDRDGDAEAAELKAYEDKSYELSHRNHLPEAVTERIGLWREAVQKYPRNFRCLEQLAYALHDTLNSIDRFPDTHEQNAREVVSICQRILRDCTDGKIRESAVQMLVYTYSNPRLSLADEDKAVQYANMAGSCYTCREKLLESAYFTEESRPKRLAHKHHNHLTFMDFITSGIVYSRWNTPEEEIFACETALRLWETLIHDGNFLFYHCRMAPIRFRLAENCARLKRRKETLASLHKAVAHAKAFDSLPVGEQAYTSVFVCEASNCTPFPEDHTDWIRQYLKKSCFDFLRDDPAFTEIQAEFE